MTAEGLTGAEREALLDQWRAAGPGEVNPIVVLAAVERILADRLAVVEAERDALRERVEALCGWGVGRDTGGVDRMVPASDLRAALDADRSTDPSAGSERA